MDVALLIGWAWGAWQVGPGAGSEATPEAARRAAEEVRLAPTALAGQAYPAAGNGGVSLIEPSVWLEVEVGRGGFARRAAWEAEAEQRDLGRVDLGATWVAGTVDGWFTAWIAEGERLHLAAHLAEIDEELASLERGVGEHLAVLDHADLVAERARYRIEVEDAARRAAAARAQLDARLGGAPGFPSTAAPLEDMVGVPEGDPWAEARPEAMPAPRAAEAAWQAAEAAARAACHDTPATLTGGLAWRSDAPTAAPTGYVAASVPIGQRRPEACVAAQGEAERARVEHRWTLEVAQAELRAGSAQLAAAREQAVALAEHSVAPLEARQALLESAWEARQVPLARVLAARWALHEAEHAALLAEAEVMRVWAQGAAARHAMEVR